MIGYPERQIEDDAGYFSLVARRAAREPLSHLTGRREFWSLDFSVTSDTLDPRPDTETLVEKPSVYISATSGANNRSAFIRSSLPIPSAPSPG